MFDLYSQVKLISLQNREGGIPPSLIYYQLQKDSRAIANIIASCTPYQRLKIYSLSNHAPA